MKENKLLDIKNLTIQYRTDLDITGWSEQDIFKH